MTAPCSPHRFVVSVFSRDRVGILHAITSVLADAGANIDAISQTTLEQYFSMILTVTFSAVRCANDIERRLRAALDASDGVDVRAIDPSDETRPVIEKAERYVLVISGPDAPGILKQATEPIARRGINIADWNVRIDGNTVSYIGSLDMPDGAMPDEVLRDISEQLCAFGLGVSLQHENIFKAMNEVGAISRLLTERPHA